jgi:hypothetical protein
MIDIHDELRRLIAKLDEQNIEYALCGGMAMAVHQRPRFTIDIDLLIEEESLQSALDVAATLDYVIRGKDLSFANGAVEIRRVSKIDSNSGDLLTLDFLLVTPEVRVAWDSRVQAEWEGGTLSVVSATGLIAMKQLRRSGTDLDDIKALEEGDRDDEG